MIKLFASDMDGTLLSPNHVISDTTAQAIRDLQAQSDIEFLIATGRDYRSAKWLLDQHQLTARIIAVNGAATYDVKGNLEDVFALDLADTQTLIQRFAVPETQTLVSLKSLNGYYVNDLSLYRRRMEDFLNRAKEAASDDSLAQIELHFKELQPLEDYRPDLDPPLKLMLIDRRPEVLESARHFLKDFTIDLTSSGPDNLEITSLKAQKGLAIEAYCQHHGFTKHQVLTIGDSANDRSMLAMFPNSYAMANASQAIKDLASYEAPSNAEDGVAHTIYQLLSKLG